MTTIDMTATFEQTSRMSAAGLHYHDHGAGPALVLLHGSGPGVTGWTNFADNLDVLGPHFRCLVVDMPGYGGSYIPDELDRPYPALAAPAVLGLLDELGIGKAHFLGNSMGAGVTAQLALLAPERVDRLVLMGPGGVGLSVFGPSPSEGIKRLMDFNDAPSRETLRAWLETMVFDQALLTDELLERRWEQSQRPGAIEWSRRTYDFLYRRTPPANPPVPLWAQSARITAPTLITWGRDDRVLPLDHAILPARLMPNAELHVFPRCGHWAMIERKADFERVVLDFLTRP
ncbi:alpha/beta fold hydrolase [Pseudonocardia ailaonensis]|uniref:Alpha/beta fold hydrolase n=1 Tax=Pseudonocardia ailaonensis TaxID=367279 RepID=A0ABN2N3X1_9PSEU